jgi:hypothetical protein
LAAAVGDISKSPKCAGRRDRNLHQALISDKRKLNKTENIQQSCVAAVTGRLELSKHAAATAQGSLGADASQHG